MKNLFSALFALLLPVMAAAQFSVSGKVTDQQTGDVLPGATISLSSPAISTIADANGKYHFNNLKSGNYTFKVSFLGYQAITKAILINANAVSNFALKPGTLFTEAVTVSATRATQNSPTAFTDLSKKDIDKNNTGRGFEYLLEQTPSTVVTSNAGAGVGYTSIRIRGSDATRTNVTLNGIPLNDAEDQGVYFVDLPDMASSVENIQVQRGVGTSTNGAGAFGASINIQTTTRHDTAYAELNNSAGSYGTVKNTASFGTGLLGDHFSFDGRLSRMRSDGYIDRASSDLKSFFLSGAYYGKKSVLRLNVFSGYEKTYQAWDGVPEDSVKAGNRRYNELGYINSSNSFYKNQTDNYTQNYYQLLYNQQLSSKLSFSGALHYTKGFGYYEEYRNADSLQYYGVTPVVVGGTAIEATDLVRRLWLNNDFYGLTYNLNYKPDNTLNATLGGAYNEYKGAHYNNIEWTQESTNIPPDYQYSRNDAKKTDFNIFARAEYHLGKWLLYGDLQYRHIYYSFLGFDENLNNVQQAVGLNFFNPKAGITYQLNDNSNVYASVAVGNHEPNRSDYTNSSPQSRPKPENLKDLELGYRINESTFSGSINGFYMLYKNQLVLTGSLDDVGEAIRTNIKDSYRAGIEASARVKIAQPLSWYINATLSANKVKNFEQYLQNYDTGTLDGTLYKTSDIAYSPDFTGSSTISYRPVKNAEIAFITKYVSRQYLDNTSTVSRSLGAYVVNDLRLNYNFSIKGVKNIGLSLLVNNIFSEKYQSDGATYPDIEGGKVVNYNYFFPQAPINFLLGLNLKF
ncbi:TonB-dependent receptor [Mucilaginibacter gotjawali]|uniref:Iron complex outermembrane receptor protein n=1 Tax=Mucilaginibacter gotjawali TaxID=1550579 RepID=A0A839SD11_9SPHI|nr:TonB-dependent receptor [Mucilaginibacter gotjawali]MBB3054780.1 iron complex outermembrane receptor protein [Mucilaginibacter gotjawali]